MNDDHRLLTAAEIKRYLGTLLDRPAARGVEVEMEPAESKGVTVPH